MAAPLGPLALRQNLDLQRRGVRELRRAALAPREKAECNNFQSGFSCRRVRQQRWTRRARQRDSPSRGLSNAPLRPQERPLPQRVLSRGAADQTTCCGMAEDKSARRSMQVPTIPRIAPMAEGRLFNKRSKALRNKKAFFAKSSPNVRTRLHSAVERMRQRSERAVRSAMGALSKCCPNAVNMLHG